MSSLLVLVDGMLVLVWDNVRSNDILVNVLHRNGFCVCDVDKLHYIYRCIGSRTTVTVWILRHAYTKRK